MKGDKKEGAGEMNEIKTSQITWVCCEYFPGLLWRAMLILLKKVINVKCENK